MNILKNKYEILADHRIKDIEYNGLNSIYLNLRLELNYRLPSENRLYSIKYSYERFAP